MLKKLCAMTLGAALLLSAVPAAFAQETTAETATDTAGTPKRPVKEIQREYRTDLKKAVGEQKTLRKDTVSATKEKNAALRAENKELLKEAPKANKEGVKANRAEMKENRVDARATIKEGRVETKEELQKAREERNATLKEKAEARKAEVAAKMTERQSAMEAKKKELEEKRKGKKEVLQTKQKENVERILAQTIAGFDKAITELHTLVGRIESRITKLETDGVDVSAAKTKLAAAETAIAAAETKVNEASLISVEVTEGETPQAALARVRTSLQSTKETIKQAHSQLVEAARALKTSPTETSGDATQ